ncbi:hypothetical protein LA080_014013 [Diaporthe eres]|nr:hypothetical protein LA080_014013 [Diaporthe eres]
MPGDAKTALNRRTKGAKKARREALGLPDPEPTPRRKRKIPKHRRPQLTIGKIHNGPNNHGRISTDEMPGAMP